MDKIFKISFFLILAYLLNTSITDYKKYTSQKEAYMNKIKEVHNSINELKIKSRDLKKKNKNLTLFTKGNQLSLSDVKQRIKHTIQEINGINSFQAKIQGLKQHDEYINVVLAKINIKELYKNFNIKDFEEVLINRFNKYSFVFPLTFKNMKETTIYLMILKKEFENEKK